MTNKFKIAIVHDFLKEYGGAERVVEALHDIYPDAPVYTSFVDFKALGPHSERLKKWKIIESPFGRTWLMRKFHSPLRFLAPWVWNSFDFNGFDVIISSSGWYMSRGVKTKKPTVHICYIHHPPRHLYGYQTAMNWQKYWIIRVYAAIVNHFLRIYDYNTAQKVDYFIANSEETRRRVQKFYRRDSEVIYPPVEIPERTVLSGKGQSLLKSSERYFLIVSRLARAKHIDLAIKVCQELGEKLMVVGKGREEFYLKELANKKPGLIEFLGEVSDEKLPEVYSNAKALIFPAEDEEFGIVPVEAMGYGVSVIALRSGGLPETIIDGKTGVFFDTLSIDSLKKAIKQFEKLSFKSEDCRKQAEKFSKEVFAANIKKFVEQHLPSS